MIHASLFSGIGGPEVAAAMLGWKNAFHCEINPFGRAVLDYWFPESKSYEDITKTDFHEWRGKIDVLTGGFPCQPFSYAGKRGGAEDERYLWPQMLRAIDEIRPTWVVGENVAGLRTMVEGGLLTDLGRSLSLFQEGDDIHGYELEQTFTIERICRDLERLGYSVQPVLIPAAAVGAPHRRDRIFILAHYDADPAGRGSTAQETGGRTAGCRCHGDVLPAERGLAPERAGGLSAISRPLADPHRRDDVRVTGEDAGTGAGDSEWVCGEAGSYSSDSDSRRGGEIPATIYAGVPDGDESFCDGCDRPATNANRQGREKSFQSGGEADCEEEGAGMDDRTLRPRRDGNPADPVCERLEREEKPGSDKGGERMRVRRDVAGHDWMADAGLIPGNRWRDFPTVSPVHRGNDGIPIRLDNLSISFGKWRTESLKAYGNAIVPQVMYRIFQAIEQA